MYGLAEDGQGRTTAANSSEWLKSAPRGAYTTARTVNGTSVFELSFHIERLAESARLMTAASAAAAPGSAAAAQPPAPPALLSAGSLRPLVLASMRAAITAYKSASSEAGGSSAVRAGAAAGVGELKVTVLSHWEGGEPRVDTHVQALGARPCAPVKVQIKGAPRANAAAKDSEWVRERQALEADQPADVNEIVLVNPDGTLMEGLSSNFFAVVDGALWTAGDGILLGTVRGVMLQVCAVAGIPVVLSPPNVADIERWEGCLIASTSRLALPVHAVTVMGPDGAATEHAFDGGGLAGRIDALVLDAIEAASEDIATA